MTHTAHSGSYDFGIGRKKVGWVLRRLGHWRFLSDVDIDCDRGCKTCSPQVDVERYCARATSSGGSTGTVTFYVEDRKSTRLNSSHVAISYAVFCLKKKKKNVKVVE